jgi:hypothetical protein
MPIPALSDQGLLPAGRHPCALSDIPQVFCWNPYRKQLWEQFQAFWGWYQPQRWAGQIYLNGGFVTDKPEPEDIDMVTDLSGLDDARAYQALLYMAQNQQKIFDTFKVHFWFNLPGNNDFAAFFQYVGIKTAAIKGIHAKYPKGILRIIE